MENLMKCEIVEIVGDNVIYKCDDHQPDSYIVIPYQDSFSLFRPEPGNMGVINITLDDIKNRKWPTVTSIVSAVDIARNEDFCIKVAGMTINEYVKYDHDEFQRNSYLQTVEETFLHLHCKRCKGKTYYADEDICNSKEIVA